jgi:hypothetical protein
LAGELFKMMTGVNIVHVPYGGGGGQAITDLLAGRMQVSFDIMPATIEYVRAGKLRGLAVTTATRSPALPDIPPYFCSAAADRRGRQDYRAAGGEEWQPSGGPLRRRDRDDVCGPDATPASATEPHEQRQQVY